MISLATLDRVLLFRAPGRRIDVLPDDIFIVSYPRSGSTWMRFLIATLIDGRPSDFVRTNILIPDIYGASRRRLKGLARPRLMKSHEYFDPRYPQVIYLVRDPRDVVMSYHDFQIRTSKIPEQYPLSSYVESFVTCGLDRFGTWQEHLGSWLGARSGRPDFLLLRYEDLRKTTTSELRRVVNFIGLQVSDAQLAKAAEQCSVAAMRELERAQAKEGVINRSRFHRPGIRSGLAGGWREHLEPALATRITEAFQAGMADLGYLDGSSERRSQAFERRVRTAAP